VIGVIGAIIMAKIALNTYESNNSIRKFELIEKVYDVFIKDDWYAFYEKIKKGKPIDFEKDSNDRKLLNETLTLFDALSYFETQGLLKDERSWEYIASEILNFALNDSVWNYIKKTEESYLSKGFHKDIIPFTGFLALLDKLPTTFKIKHPQEDQFKILSPENKSYYYNQVKNIPDTFKLSAAIIIFVQDKEKNPFVS
jgi:hypothetical protein